MKTSEKWYEVRKDGIAIYSSMGRMEARKFFNNWKNQPGIEFFVCSFFQGQHSENLIAESKS